MNYKKITETLKLAKHFQRLHEGKNELIEMYNVFGNAKKAFKFLLNYKSVIKELDLMAEEYELGINVKNKNDFNKMLKMTGNDYDYLLEELLDNISRKEYNKILDNISRI